MSSYLITPDRDGVSQQGGVPRSAEGRQTGSVTSPYLKRVPYLNISLQRGTDEVPSDGRYYVLRGSDVVATSGSETIALAQFELLEEQERAANPHLKNPRDLIKREAAFSDIMGVKGDAKNRRTAGEQAKGGKGGRSGV